QRQRVPRGWAIALVLAALLVVVTLAIVLIVPPAAEQGRQLVEQAPALVGKLREVAFIRFLLDRFNIPENEAQLRQRTTELASGALPPLLTAIGGALSFAAGLLTMLFLVAFLLIFA